MSEEVNFNAFAEKLSALDIDNWDAHLGWDRTYYETRLGEKFDVTLSVNYKDKLFNADDKDYKLSVSSKSTSDLIIISGKEVRNLFGLIENKYNSKLNSNEKEGKNILIKKLNEFLQTK